MLRPETFSHPHIAFRDTPYSGEIRSGSSPGEPAAPTLLAQGQIIWTRSRFALGDMPARTVAFVEELGLISLDPRWLVPAEPPAATIAASPGRSVPSAAPRSNLRRVS